MIVNFYKKFWRKYRLLMLSIHLIAAVFCFSDFIFGSKPLLCKYQNAWYFMVIQGDAPHGSQFMADLSTLAEWDYRKLKYDFSIWPWIYLDAKEMNSEAAWLPPFSSNEKQFKYILGSYDLGRDVFAACLYGLKKSLSLSILVILFSFLPGLLIGSLFVFHSQRYHKISIYSWSLLFIAGVVLIYGLGLFAEWRFVNIEMLLYFILCIGILMITAYLLRNRNPQIAFNFDGLSLRYIEIMKSIPVLLILLLLLQIFKNPGTYTLAGIISLIYIPNIAKYARSFTMNILQEHYITSAFVIGQSGWKIFTKHILPKLVLDLLPVFAFGIANIILLEAALSFLGLGLPIDQISLGTLMHTARLNPSAWWVVIFPGVLVFWLVYTFNSLAQLGKQETLIRDL